MEPIVGTSSWLKARCDCQSHGANVDESQVGKVDSTAIMRAKSFRKARSAFKIGSSYVSVSTVVRDNFSIPRRVRRDVVVLVPYM